MAGDNEVKNEVQAKAIDGTSPFYLHPSDNPGTMISSCILKGDNYELWEKAMRNALRAKNKLGFINGTVSKPEDTKRPEALLWGPCNSMLVSWLFNSIDSSLQPSIAYWETVKELWDDLREHFSIKNAPRIHQLKADIAAAKQQGQSVVAYYTRLKGMWDELSKYSHVPVCKCGGCTCNAAAELAKEREEERTHQFLMGLEDSMFGTIRTNILSMDPLPNLNKVYAMVVQEERHKTVVRGREERTDAVGFAVHASKFDTSQNKIGVVERPTCSHCGKTGHEISRCFELIGYLEGWSTRGRGGRDGRGGHDRGRNQGQASAHAVQGVAQNSGVVQNSGAGQGVSQAGRHTVILGLTDAQVQQIVAVLSNSNTSNSGVSNERMNGKNLNWILDSGASHHMTGNIDCMFDVCKISKSSVELPNGEHTMAECEGSVMLKEGITLKHVLYVPSLSCNLISIGSLIKDNGYLVTFTNELCVIQDCTLKMLIGVGELRDGVYYYHSTASAKVCHLSKGVDYKLWHQRMGHPSAKITSMLPGVKFDGSTSKDVCEVCLTAKQTRDAFPVSLNNPLNHLS